MKKITLFLSVIAMLLCLFAISVSADEIYSDFTKPGSNGEAPVFNFLGYAVDEDLRQICVEYTVDLDALSKYEDAVGKKLGYGFVVALKENVENGKPLDANGLPTGANKDKIFIKDLNNSTSFISIILTGLTEETFSEQIVLSLYVKGASAVNYISDTTSTAVVETVSYESLTAPTEVTINGMIYSTKAETTPSSQRMGEMAESKAAYNTVTMSSSDASSITSKANLVITGGSLLGWNNAAKLMQHFMDGSGKQYDLDMKTFLQDSITGGYRNSDINSALRAAEALALVGKTVDVNQKGENLHRASSGDWYYAMNYYFSDVDVLNLTVTVDENGVKTYNADIRYIAVDYYNWDKNNTTPVINKKVLFFTITGPSPAELYRLHEAGIAQEFLTYGEITYSNVTWTEGQTVDQIAGLK